jgi:hypothetical protein
VKSHYTYKMSFMDLYYYGVRSCYGSPYEDEYYSSSEVIRDMRAYKGITFIKQILNVYPTRYLANEAEQNLLTPSVIDDPKCINLNSQSNPYTRGRAGAKISYFKSVVPQFSSDHRFVDTYRRITPMDINFRVSTQIYNNGRGKWPIWKFLAHPDRMIEYLPSTGTTVYAPGREDRLMSDNLKSGVTKYYLTDIASVSGSELESAMNLLVYHTVPGQTFLVLNLIAERMRLMTPNQIVKFKYFLDKIWSISPALQEYQFQYDLFKKIQGLKL